MKCISAILSLFALGVSALASERRQAAPTAPQPRVRLQQGTTGTRVHIEQKPAVAVAAAAPVLMEKMVVTDSKLPAIPRRIEQPEQTSFSPLLGGPLLQRKAGSALFEIGIWPWVDILAEDEAFRPGTVRSLRVNFELVRIRW